MRRLLLALPLAVLFTMIAPSLHAAVYTLDPVTDPLGDCSGAATPDECMASGNVTTTCTNSYGCPQCALDGTQTNSICYVIAGNYGWCKCVAQGGVTYDKFGQKMGNCTHSGYCTTR